MAISKTKITETIVKLMMDTQTNKICWQASSLDKIELEGDGELLGAIFLTRIKEKRLMLYKYKYKSNFAVLSNASNWHTSYCLSIVNNKDETVWNFPYDSSIESLYSEVAFMASGAEEFIDDLLGN